MIDKGRRGNLKKYIGLIVCVLLLVACGQDNDINEGGGDKPVNSDKSVDQINDTALTPSLVQKEGSDEEYRFVYTVVNKTNKPVTLTFNTGQTFDYILKDKTGKILVRYSDGKSFIQVISEKELAAGAQLTHDILLKDLEPGEYTLEAWLTAKGMEDGYKEKIKFKVE